MEDLMKLYYPQQYPVLPSPPTTTGEHYRSMEATGGANRSCTWCGQAIGDVTYDESDSGRSERRLPELVSHLEQVGRYSPRVQSRQKTKFRRAISAAVDYYRDEVERKFDPDVPNLQFCSDDCVNQYKMNWFCSETRFYLQQKQVVQLKTETPAAYHRELASERTSHIAAAAVTDVDDDVINDDVNKPTSESRARRLLTRDTRSPTAKRRIKLVQINNVNPATKAISEVTAAAKKCSTFHSSTTVDKITKKPTQTTRKSDDDCGQSKATATKQSRLSSYSRDYSSFGNDYKNCSRSDFKSLPTREDRFSSVNAGDGSIGYTSVSSGSLDRNLPVAPTVVSPLQKPTYMRDLMLTFGLFPPHPPDIWSARSTSPVLRLPVPVPVPIFVPFPVSVPAEGSERSSDNGVLMAERDIIQEVSTKSESSYCLEQTFLYNPTTEATVADRSGHKPISTLNCSESPVSNLNSDSIASEVLDLSNVRSTTSMMEMRRTQPVSIGATQPVSVFQKLFGFATKPS